MGDLIDTKFPARLAKNDADGEPVEYTHKLINELSVKTFMLVLDRILMNDLGISMKADIKDNISGDDWKEE